MPSDKSTRWSVTAFAAHTYAALDEIRQNGHPLIAEIGWQDEICPKTQKPHRQGYCRTVRQVRLEQLKGVIPGAHLEVAINWIALKDKYCTKEETRDPSGEQVRVQFERPMRLHEMLIRVAKDYLRTDAPSEETLIALDRQTDRQPLLKLLRKHSYILCWSHPEYAIVLSRQDARDAWCAYFLMWVEKAQHEIGEGQ